MSKLLLSSLLCTLSVASFAASRMPQPTTVDSIYVEIAKNFNTIQCQEFPTQQQKLDELHKQLKAANISTYQARITDDGRVYPAVCGSQIGHRAVFQIAQKDLQKSQSLGFSVYKAH